MRIRDDFRDWHYLRPLLGSATPANLLFFDTETYPIADAANARVERHHLRLWCATAFRYEDGCKSRADSATGDNAESFWDFTLSRSDKKRPLWMFAHNLGFDLTVLGFWDLLLRNYFEFQQQHNPNCQDGQDRQKVKWSGIAVMNDPPCIFKFRLNSMQKTFVAVDTFNYFRTSLAEIGKSVGCQKSKMPPYKAGNKVWADYCFQDVTVLEKAVLPLIDLVRKEGLGKFAYTVSGQAMNAYRARFMTTETPILIHGNRSAVQLERESYHGGAVHVLYLGGVRKGGTKQIGYLHNAKREHCISGPVYVLDKQSFYPSIMGTNVFPYKLDKIHLTPSLPEIQSAVDSKGVIASVAIECDGIGYPVTRNGKTFYAQGKIKTVLPGPELARAMMHGCVKKCWAMALYQVAPLFNDYVNFFWDLRKKYTIESNPAFAYMCKLILNSLYGRFGMKSYKWESVTNVIPPKPFGYWWESAVDSQNLACYRAMCWLPQIQCTSICDQHNCDGKSCVNPGHCTKNPMEHMDSFPAIPSYVTSYGREEMLDSIGGAGWNNVLYSDTDSLHVTKAGYDNLDKFGEIAEGEMGKLRLVETVHQAEYRGYKDYVLGTREIMAGIKTDAKRKGKGRYEQRQFQRLASVLAGNELDSIAVEKIVINRKPYVPLGRVGTDGRVASPVLNEW